MRLTYSTLDNTTPLFDSLAHRYKVYCEDKGFLSAIDYPHKMEVDQYDRHSVHIVSQDEGRAVVGSVRLVLPSARGFPLIEHCTLHPDYAELVSSAHCAEVSRLCSTSTACTMGLYKAVYQVSKERGITHWLVAMERSLFRLLNRTGFAFQQIGDQIDYYGPVAPYLAEVATIEDNVRAHNLALFKQFT